MSEARPIAAPSWHAERVPLELWLQIIQCSDFSHNDFANIACVSKFLAWAAQPPLFSHFTVTQPCAKKDDKVGKCQHPAYRMRFLQRLQFIKTEHIAAAVKSVSILFEPKVLLPHVYEGAGELVAADEILDEIFDALSFFPNIEEVSACEVDFTPVESTNFSPCLTSRVSISKNVPHPAT